MGYLCIMKTSCALVAIAALMAIIDVVGPAPAHAQFLGPFLDAQRNNNIRMHQQRMIQKRQMDRRKMRQTPPAYRKLPDPAGRPPAYRDHRGNDR